MASFVRVVRALRVALFGLPHRHHWETLRGVKLEMDGGSVIGTRYILRCTGCGEIKKRDCV